MTLKTAVGLDLSWSCTGLVSLKLATAVFATTVKSDPKNFDHAYHRLALIADRVMKFIYDAAPDLIVTEGYSFGSKNAREQMGELGGHIRYRLWDEGYPFYVVPPTSLKKFVTGTGNANKTKVALSCLKRWNFESDDDNITDAYGLARIGEAILAGKDTKEFKTFMKKLELIGDRTHE